ncbi:MAG: flagellar export protein FliJ [Chloroflexota bacterium]
MRRFRFSLERVLKVAAIRERLATQEFAAAMRRLREEQEGLRQAKGRRRQAQSELEARTRGVIDVTGVLMTIGCIEAVTVEIEQREQRVAAAAAVAEEKRQALLACMKSRKTLEKLRERRYEDYRAAVLGEEQRAIDEMAQRIALQGR